MVEPTRYSLIALLQPYVAERVKRILTRMVERGFDPYVFESRRSKERQEWLYGIGRTHSFDRKPVTWTKNSKHIDGKAVDIISDRHKWNAPPAFWTALWQEANREGMHVLKAEKCHIEWRG